MLAWLTAEPATASSLIEAAQARWRTVDAPHLVAPARAGARLERGTHVERVRPEAA